MSSGDPPILSAAQSDRGVRETNQDSVVSAVLPDGRWLAAVADGMGGLEDGEVASRTAVRVLVDRLSRGASLLGAVEEANRTVFRESRGRPMGTTLVAALLDGPRLRIANVGDSRGYLHGPAGLVQVTRDHTFGAEAVRHDTATGGEVAASRWGTTLTRSLGAAEVVEVDEFGPYSLEPGVQVLLCSDGVHGVLPDDTIEGCLAEAPGVDAAVERLMGLALERGSRDNVSAIILQRGTRDPREGGSASMEEPPGGGHGNARTREEAGPGEEPGEEDPRSDGPASDLGLPEGEEPAAWEGARDAGDPAGDRLEFVLPDEAAGHGREAPPPAFQLPRDIDRDDEGDPRWDPGRLVARSATPRRRKPGRARGLLLVVAIAAVLLLILWALP